MCKKHDQLLQLYKERVRSFAMSLDALQAAIAISATETRAVEEFVEESRVIAENVRLRLEKHVREHGCRRHDDTN